MVSELLNWLFGTSFRFERVDRDSVVVASTGYKVARGREATAHDPGTLEGDDVDLVVRVCVPNQQLAIL